MLIFTFMTACGGDQTTEQEDPGDAPASDGELVAPRIVKMTIKDYGTITLELDPMPTVIKLLPYIADPDVKDAWVDLYQEFVGG